MTTILWKKWEKKKFINGTSAYEGHFSTMQMYFLENNEPDISTQQ